MRQLHHSFAKLFARSVELDPILEKRFFYKIGRISANNGPIWKIQNLAYSGLRARPVEPSKSDARDVAREMTVTRARAAMDYNQVKVTDSAKINPSRHRDFDDFSWSKVPKAYIISWCLLSSFRNTLNFENRTIIKGDTASFVRQGQVKMHMT